MSVGPPFRLLAFAAVLLVVPGLSSRAASAAETGQATTVLAHARKALGGETALAAVHGLRVTGAFRRIVGGGREMDGTLEIDIELPDKYVRVETMDLMGGMTVTRRTGFNSSELISSSAQHGAAPGMVIRLRQPTGKEGMAHELAGAQADFGRNLVMWLLTPPPNAGDTFSYVGRAEAPHGTAEVIDAKGPNGFAVRLFLGTKTGRPLMATWRARSQQIRMMTRHGRPGERHSGPPPALGKMGPPPEVNVQMFFSDYRKVGGIRFPFEISRSEDGKPVESWHIKKVEVNPTFGTHVFDTGK